MCGVGGSRRVPAGNDGQGGRAGQGPPGVGGDGGGAAVADQVDLGDVWKATLEELVDEISSRQQRAYLQLTKLRAIVEGTALISVPDAFPRDAIESRLRPAIAETLSRRLTRPIQVAVTVKPPEDGTGLPGTVYGTPVESGADEVAEPQPRDYAQPEPMRAEPPPAYEHDPYANPTPPPAAYRNVPSARG